MALKRIREDRDDAREDALAGRPWGEIGPRGLPPCSAESGAFMSAQPWSREFRHPYSSLKKAEATHGVLRPTTFPVPEYSTFAVPFAWMLRENQQRIDESHPEPLPPDIDPPFPSPWIFGAARQEAVLDLVFNRLEDGNSLSFFYCKEGQPLGDAFPRLIVGLGRITSVGSLLRYETEGAKTYPLWDRLIRHSVRPDGHDGFLLPYHEYLESTGDRDEDERRSRLLREIALTVEPSEMRAFSYGSELATSDVALSCLTRALECVRRVREHGVAPGPWERREDWINARMAGLWEARGAFPGVGAALEALGMRLGTALSIDLARDGLLQPEADPWPLLDGILRGQAQPPHPAYEGDLAAVARTWAALPDQRKDLLKLLSRFALSPEQARRWFDPLLRARAVVGSVDDQDLLANPYRIAEEDLGDKEALPVGIAMLDRGMLPDATIAAHHPVPLPARVESSQDARRVRAALVTVLRRAAEAGDALLSVEEALDRLSDLNLARPTGVGVDWVEANREYLSDTIDLVEIVVDGRRVPALQLSELGLMEQKLARILSARAQRPLASAAADWRALLIQAIGATGTDVDLANERHALALEEQAKALECVTTRKLSVLVGGAGTGKTSVLGALMLAPALRDEGILLLAPTGKARVRLGRIAGAEAMTIAQFLNGLDRYDGDRQRPLFAGKKYRKERTVVVDECSMLTMPDLYAVLDALDLAHVQRLILVGDPNQLPPIGVGRPFADFVGHLEQSEDGDSGGLANALARLDVELRTVQGGPSHALKLAAWFTRQPQPVDSDRVLGQVEQGSTLNDLSIDFWTTPEELRARLLAQFTKHLSLKDGEDVDGFNAALGFDEKGWVPFGEPDGAELFQILSPVRSRPHGVGELNRWVQHRFRAKELANGRRYHATLGDEEIVRSDKVIQVRNERRWGWDGAAQEKVKDALANGEIGTVARYQRNGGWFNVLFAGRPNLTFGYRSRDFPDGSGPLELAYALTIHKAQGSEFQTVFVVLPRNTSLLSRELIYTALTRSRKHLVLLLEGTDASFLYDLTQRSETARRNTNLFRGVVRERVDVVPFAEHLIHRTTRGEMVRSKSELVIANLLHGMDLPYVYERRLEGEVDRGPLRPDFSFVDPAGDLIVWEHLGMLHRKDYREGWEWKKAWYQRNGYVLGETLFTSEDDERGGLDSESVRRTAEQVRQRIS